MKCATLWILCPLFVILQLLQSAVSIKDKDTGSDPDNVQVTLNFSNGSIGSLIYTSIGSSLYSKERLEVFGNGLVGVIDSWRELFIKGGRRTIKKKLLLRSERLSGRASVIF